MDENFIEKLSTDTGIIENIPPDELRKLHSLMKPVRLAKDDYFLRIGEIPRRIGINITGILRLFYIDNSGKDITKHFCTRKSLAISYRAFIQREPSKFNIQALEETKLLTFTYENYQQLLNSHTCWQIAARKLSELVFILKEKREAELLLMDARERYQSFINDFPDLLNRIPQYYIASYLHITPESLSRIRADFKN